MRSFALIIGLSACAALLSGCLVEQRYVTPDEGGPWSLAIEEDTPAYITSEDGNVYLVEQRIPIEFRRPTDEDRAALATQAMDVDPAPFPELPWLQRGDIEIQVDWTLSNLSEDTVTTSLIINGANQFHEYNPGIQVVDDELQIDYSQWERTYRLEPMERRSGTVREEELDEVAVDLATVINSPNPNQIVYFENQSFNDRRSQMYMPDVIPALVGLRVGLRSQQAAPILLELTVRVRDVRGVLVQGEDEPWMAPQPALFGPANAVATPTP